MEAIQPDKLITVSDYAKSINVSPSYVYKQYREYIKGYRIRISFEVVNVGGVLFIKK